MIDFKEISTATSLYNFHSHTQFCDGRATMEEFVEAAVNAGMLHYGFTPHSPVPIDSPCNMSGSSVREYFDEVNRLRSLYSGRISLYAGMEIDYLGPDWGPSHSYFSTLPLDYRIGSIHFVASDSGPIDIDGRFPSFQKKMHQFFADDIEAVVRSFYQATSDMIDAGGFDIIGHFDKIGHNASHFRPGIEDEPWYRSLADDTVDHILDSRLIVEINTKALSDHKRFFPATRHWQRLLQAGTVLLVNSDTHYPHLVQAGRHEALDLLKKLSL
ncbi:MAG: histidinol-phosphatase [Bacteroides sp.]|nr:histidinol-phosphatase [Bacteroides sp.]